MNTIRARDLGQRLIEMLDRFSVIASRQRHLAETVMRGGIVFVDLECFLETRARFFQKIQFQKDVTEVHRNSYVVWLQSTRDTITTDRIFETTFLLIEFRNQVSPAEIFGGEEAGIQVAIVSRRN